MKLRGFPKAKSVPLYSIEPGGRISLASNTPVTVTNQVDKTELVYTPYKNNHIDLYHKNKWGSYLFDEEALTLSSLTASRPHDILVRRNVGNTSNIELNALAWTDGASRAVELIRKDGVLVKTGYPEFRFLGTIYIDAAQKCQMIYTGAPTAKLFVWNNYNQIAQKAHVRDATTSWTYATNVYRQMRGQAANKFEFIIGISEHVVRASLAQQIMTTIANDKGYISIGLDSITATHSDSHTNYQRTSAADLWNMVNILYSGYPGIGYHYLAPLECAGTGTVTFYGNGSSLQILEGVIYG